MSPRRTLSLPKLATSSHDQDAPEITMSSIKNRPSRLEVIPDRSSELLNIHVAPTVASPRSHSRWPSSGSSIATAPDSPANMAKPALGDLVEEPSEREEVVTQESPEDFYLEPFCICDSPFCEHSRNVSFRSAGASPTSPEFRSFGRALFDEPNSPTDRRDSDGSGHDSNSMRLSRRWPSISRRWRDRKGTKSMSTASARSAPPSRASSVLHGQSFASPVVPPYSPRANQQAFESGFASYWPVNADTLQVAGQDYGRNNGDILERSPTPLLPPVITDMQYRSSDEIQSPLEAPSVAMNSTTNSYTDSPQLTAATTPTPPLSAKPSITSIGLGRSSHARLGSNDIPPMSLTDGHDRWALRLGHANFHIVPEPYFPKFCDIHSCTQLLEDWETARREFLRQAVWIREHYGPTSTTFKLTWKKWDEIDAQWRAKFDQTIMYLEARGIAPPLQALPELQPLSRMPSLNDPENPEKFPVIDAADIVGPMVQHCKISSPPQSPSKRANPFLKFFTSGRN